MNSIYSGGFVKTTVLMASLWAVVGLVWAESFGIPGRRWAKGCTGWADGGCMWTLEGMARTYNETQPKREKKIKSPEI